MLALLESGDPGARALLKRARVGLDDLENRLGATLKLSAGEAAPPERVSEFGRYAIDGESNDILYEANAWATGQRAAQLEANALLFGMLMRPESRAGQFLGQYGLQVESLSDALSKVTEQDLELAKPEPTTTERSELTLLGVSPVFIGLVLFTAFSAVLTYSGIGNSRGFMVFFIIGCWLISLSLHEFGHAIVAYFAGDR